jgi:hypothetical protein
LATQIETSLAAKGFELNWHHVIPDCVVFRAGQMPIIETLKPRDPEQLQTKIFATATGEDDVILIAVQEHVRPFKLPSPLYPKLIHNSSTNGAATKPASSKQNLKPKISSSKAINASSF